jgi:hypothetical protein
MPFPAVQVLAVEEVDGFGFAFARGDDGGFFFFVVGWRELASGGEEKGAN